MPLTISKTINAGQKIGRNDPCFCGSGKKYKKCHFLQEQTKSGYTPQRKTKLLSRISEFLIGQPFFQNLVNKATLDIYGKDEARKNKDGKIEMEEYEIGTLIDAVIFEGRYHGESPLAYFVKHAPLSETERKLYQEWLGKTRYSAFEVLEVTIGKSLLVKDLFDNKTFLVYEKTGTYEAQPGIALTGRIVPFEDAWMFTGGTNITLTPELLYAFKRTGSDVKPGDLRQLDIIKLFEVKDEAVDPLSTVKDPVAELKKEIKTRNLDLSLELVKKFPITQEGMKDMYDRLGPKATSAEDLEYLVSLVFKVSGLLNEKTEPGPSEKLLITTMMQEAHNEVINKTKNFSRLSPEEQQKRIDVFTSKWLVTPQPELGNKTPKEIISAERKEIGLPEPEYRHSITATRIPDVNDRFGREYDKAVDLMRKYQYLEALEIFTDLFPHSKGMDDPFRWWLNTGSCLANLGEETLAKKFYEKALRMNPKYAVAKDNLAVFHDPKKVRSLHLGGRNRLFISVLQKGIAVSCKGVETNELLHDARYFLEYFSRQPVTLTKTRRDIPLSTITLINRQFMQPDPEELVVRVKRQQIRTIYREEWQYPKINFLHTLFLHGGLVKDTKKQFIVTKDGEKFLQLSPQEQYSILLNLWLVRMNWVQLEPPGKGSLAAMREKLNNPAIEVMQKTAWNMLENLAANKGKDIDYLRLTEGIFPQAPADPLFLSMSSILLDRIFIRYLLWSGIAESRKAELPKRGAWVPQDFLPLNFPLHITPFGLCVLEAIEQVMHDSISSVLRTII